MPPIGFAAYNDGATFPYYGAVPNCPMPMPIPPTPPGIAVAKAFIGLN